MMGTLGISRYLGCLLVVLWWWFLSRSDGTLTVLDTNQSYPANDFYLALPEDSQTFQGRMIPGKVGPGCKLLIDPAPFPGVFNTAENSNTDIKTVLLIDHSEAPSPTCQMAMDVLTHNHDLAFPVDVFLFVSPYSYPYDFGGVDEPYFALYSAGLPIKQDLLVIGKDTAVALSDILTSQPLPDGLRIAVSDTTGPWNRYLHSPEYKFMRWFFVALRALFLLYAVIHIFLMVRSGNFHGIFKPLLYTTIILHIVFYMIGPKEVTFTRLGGYMDTFAWCAIDNAYFLLLYRWGRVVYQCYRWRWFRIHFAMIFIGVLVTLIWIVTNILVMYDVGREGATATFVIVGRIYITCTFIFLNTLFYICLATWVIIHQLRLHRVGGAVKSLIKLTKLCIFCVTGWFIIGISLSMTPTVWSVPIVSLYITQCMLFHIGSIWITFAIFWQLSLTGISPFGKLFDLTVLGSSRPTEPSGDRSRTLDSQQLSLASNQHYQNAVGREKPSFSRPPSEEACIDMELLCYHPPRYSEDLMNILNPPADKSRATLIQNNRPWPVGKPQGLYIPEPPNI
ncbi:hypothetical protein IWQ62_004085 [Dispira parvispora]|uniref:Uncharacterized protein n=1 Tax=Dispira parvispora TaxID=1520584 RepID=A0A9W8ATK6_9FUNG|nr:hypothetical protein IWQ62_004085 [Dispira parvispora]